MANFLSRIFSKKEIGKSTAQTAPLSPAKVPSIPSLKRNQPIPPQYIVATAQSIGKVRDHNEDSIYIFNTVIAGETQGIPLGIFIVADGMGGHQHGEAASDAAIRAMAGSLLKEVYLPTLSDRVFPQANELQEIMLQGVLEAQEAVKREAPGGGTTLTCAFMAGNQITITHVGDSRAYFISMDGGLEVATRDHSLVRRLQELGQLTEKEASIHPQRNVLYRAIGQGEPFDPDVNTMPFPAPGYLMLCSDGLWGVIPEEKITNIIRTEPDLMAACNHLVEAANSAGGPDNISVVLVKHLG